MKTKKYHSVGTVPKYNRKIVYRDKIDIPNTQIHDQSPSWFGTGRNTQIHDQSPSKVEGLKKTKLKERKKNYLLEIFILLYFLRSSVVEIQRNHESSIL
jgi:hypothetical protein